MNERLLELREHMKKGGRVERSDLPKEMRTLEECVNLHPAEYAVKYELMEQRVRELEKNKQELESEVCALLGRYGDIWYEGFHSAQEQQKNENMWCITDVSPDELLAMSEAAEAEHIRKDFSIDAEAPRTNALNKFALEQKIGELLEFRGSLGCLDNRDASKFALAINKRIEQLRKEQDDG